MPSVSVLKDLLLKQEVQFFFETCRDCGAIPSDWLLGATFDLFDAVKLNGNIDLEDITVIIET